jgi:hypothetical protein
MSNQPLATANPSASICMVEARFLFVALQRSAAAAVRVFLSRF